MRFSRLVKSLSRPPRAERHFRVDPRLVHATMMNVWVPSTGARLLLIADENVAADSKRRAILEMSAMGEAAVRFTTEDEVAGELERCEASAPVIVLFSSLESAERAVRAGLPVDRLNVGHVPEGPGRELVHPAVYLGPSDYTVIDRLDGLGVVVFIQPLPRDKLLDVPRRAAPVAGSHHPPADTTELEPSSRAHAWSTLPSREREDIEQGALRARLRVVNAKGLHLRAAHLFAQLAGTLPCEVRVGSEGNWVNAKSLLGLTTLGASCGTLLDVEVEGSSPGQAMETIRKLFDGGFEEGADWVGGEELEP